MERNKLWKMFRNEDLRVLKHSLSYFALPHIGFTDYGKAYDLFKEVEAEIKRREELGLNDEADH